MGGLLRHTVRCRCRQRHRCPAPDDEGARHRAGRRGRRAREHLRRHRGGGRPRRRAPGFADVLPGHPAHRPPSRGRGGDSGHRRGRGGAPLRPDAGHGRAGRRWPAAGIARCIEDMRPGARGSPPGARGAASASRRASASIRARTSERSATAARWSPRRRRLAARVRGSPTTGGPTPAPPRRASGEQPPRRASGRGRCRRSCPASTTGTPGGVT